MSRTTADLLQLQGNIKGDPASYSDEFGLQWRHYKACLQLFLLKPSQESQEFGELLSFIAQVSPCYPSDTKEFPEEIMGLLEQHHALLDPGLRQTLVKALILLRNRGQLSPTALLPLLFKLFRVQDKALRQLVFRHITADIKNSNRKGRNERLNRAVQNFMYSVLQDEHEGAAKKGLAVMTEMWRRHIWRDARTVNVIASAALHKSSRIMLAALKFFLGQDEAESKEQDSSDDDDDDKQKPTGPTKEDLYSAFHKGTASTKKRKQRKLKRVQAAVKKAERREEGGRHESFAALQLLHDPQGFAEKLFSRLQGSNEKFETRLALMTVISRTIGVHKLLVLNFYPFLQKYIAPQQREVTHILAALVQACHDLVPPDVLAPVIRQLVDQFVHDRVRPEVVTIGLKTVRELCTRTPLVMTHELLQDLTAYKKYRNKAVSSAARGLISLFRELAPGMLDKKDRGRGADLGRERMQYGAAQIADHIEGVELLAEARRTGLINSDGELVSEGEGQGEGDASGDEEDGYSSEDGEGHQPLGSDAAEGADGAAVERASDSEGEAGEEAAAGSDSESGWSELEEDDEAEGGGAGSVSDEGEGAEGSGSGEEEALDLATGSDEEAVAGGDSGGGEDAPGSASEREADDSRGGRRKRQRREPAPKQQPKADSMAALKKQLAAAKGSKEQQQQQQLTATADAEAAGRGGDAVPLEWGRILSEEDFERIRQLKHRKLVEQAMQKHGLKSASKRRKALEAAEEEAEEMLELKERLGVMNEHRVAADDLLGSHKYRKDKEERMAAVLAGREGRDFGAKSKLKKNKTGGLSNREKAHRKRLPVAARAVQAKRRQAHKKRGGGKNFKGHVKKG